MGWWQTQRLVTAALLGSAVCGCRSRAAPTPSEVVPATDAVPPSYRVVHGWPHVPRGELLGQVSGVGIGARGDVLVFRRASRSWLSSSDTLSTEPIAEPTVLRFNAETGELVAAWGARQFAMPHGLSVDHQGNVWLTDVALHQVFKLDQAANSSRLGSRGCRARIVLISIGPPMWRKRPQRLDLCQRWIPGTLVSSSSAQPASSSANGGSPAAPPASSTCPMGSPWTPQAGSTWPMAAATLASRCSSLPDASWPYGAATRWVDHGRFALARTGSSTHWTAVIMPEHGPDRARVLKLSATG